MKQPPVALRAFPHLSLAREGGYRQRPGKAGAAAVAGMACAAAFGAARVRASRVELCAVEQLP
ncbi:hypothetical protein PY257_03510 [Ramlibacter sp. H39-3-26]|uniref:hypothetical protein n=1 Tax=Curvibacter soli TaxID=3031331 RepID=UPI0023DA22A9|nr:hypothetical protein [Ramlibacter sp. H39-3-26]MDF1484255.1 hypothetical protein [Ramlibacter sp. H39-3-26]